MLLEALAISIVGGTIVWLQREAADAIRQARWDHVGWELEGLIYSDRDRPLVPLLAGMVDELAVKGIAWGFKGNTAQVSISLAWWAKPECLYRMRLLPKAKRLLHEGGIRKVTYHHRRSRRAHP